MEVEEESGIPTEETMRTTGIGVLTAAWILTGLVAAGTGDAYAAEQPTEQTKNETKEPTQQELTIEALSQQVESLQKQLGELQRQIQALKDQKQEAQHKAEEERLKQAAAAAAASAAQGGKKGEVDTTTDFVSGTRMQPQLNPEVSVTGNMFGIAESNGKERASVGEWEVDVQSYLDPFSRVHFVLSKPEDEGVEIEEGYVTWQNLPGSTALTLGKKRQQFGALNRYHPHAYDQADVPLVLEESFGEEGLKGTGLSFDWLMPHVWADANELTVEVMNGDNEVAFAGGDFEHPSFLARLKSYWDLTDDSYLEIGLNGLHGQADPDLGLEHDFQAVDFTYNWNPAGRALYRDFTLRGLVLRSDLDREAASSRTAWGGYVYGQFQFTPHWIAGLRFDQVDDQRIDSHHYWGVSPYITFWQSEFVRLRAQGSYRDNNLTGVDRRLLLQLTVAAGPHKHESY